MSYQPKDDLEEKLAANLRLVKVVRQMEPPTIAELTTEYGCPMVGAILEALHALDQASDELKGIEGMLREDRPLRVELRAARVEIQKLCIRVAAAVRRDAGDNDNA